MKTVTPSVKNSYVFTLSKTWRPGRWWPSPSCQLEAMSKHWAPCGCGVLQQGPQPATWGTPTCNLGNPNLQPGEPQPATWGTTWGTWRIIPWLVSGDRNHGDRVVGPLRIGLDWTPSLNGRTSRRNSMGVILTTYKSWDDPPSGELMKTRWVFRGW